MTPAELALESVLESFFFFKIRSLCLPTPELHYFQNLGVKFFFILRRSFLFGKNFTCEYEKVWSSGVVIYNHIFFKENSDSSADSKVNSAGVTWSH